MLTLDLTRLGGAGPSDPWGAHDPKHLRLEHHARPLHSNMVTTCRNTSATIGSFITLHWDPSLNIKCPTVCAQSLKIENQIQICGCGALVFIPTL